MNFLIDTYQKALANNEKNLRFWENYVKNLRSLDFTVFAEKLKVPTLVPVGSRIFFRGELKHTNEVTVALGADYFVKCSLNQAEILRQHRIKDAQTKLEMYQKEREHLESQMSFSKSNIYEDDCKEIVEAYKEDEDKAWREKHRENIKRYKQLKPNDDSAAVEKTDEELWNRLDELELQEELENEFLSIKEDNDSGSEDSFIIKDDENIVNDIYKNSLNNFSSLDNEHESRTMKSNDSINNNKDSMQKKVSNIETSKPTSKLDLLLQAIEKQNELKNKLLELKEQDKSRTKTESELIAKLDELQELDELEDEIDRLDDMIGIDDEETDEDSMSQPSKVKRSVSFADEDDSETLEITFKHSPMLPVSDKYDPDRGITKPSDIYECYSNLFGNQTTPILKKRNYVGNKENDNTIVNGKKENKTEMQETELNKTFVVEDVIEKIEEHNSKLHSDSERPTSLFKKKRMQSKLLAKPL